MMRLWERALRRARLPLRMSQGFNPRPHISLVEPRSVGVTSDAELLDFELGDWMNPDTVLDRIARELPDGVTVTTLDLVRPTDKARPAAVVYEATLPQGCPDLPARAAALLARDKAPVVRHRPTGDKALDARPFIESLEADDPRLRMVLLTGPGGTVRPDEILRLVGLPPEAVRRTDIKRVEIRLG